MLISLKPLALCKISCSLTKKHINLHDKGADQPCDDYEIFTEYILNNSRNFFNLQRVFFPPNDASPVFVTVKYHLDKERNSTVYFWSSAAYFFFHPVEIFQFTSLLFSDPSPRTGIINLFLPATADTNSSCMVLLTQRVSWYK